MTARTSSELIQAAISFDEAVLSNSDSPGAAHFVGIMRLDPRHLQHVSAVERQIPKEIASDDSFLFAVGEQLRVAMEGRIEDALAMSLSTEVLSPLERLLELLVRSWLKPSEESFAEIRDHVETSPGISQEVISRSYLKLMTWALESFGIKAAGPYYDLALSAASGTLEQAIRQIGSLFGRDESLFFPPPNDDLILFPRIRERAMNASAELTIKTARGRIARFTRTFGADPRTLPIQFRAAELQADWTGALWLSRTIWRLKGAILLLEDVEGSDERIDGIAAWISSGADNLFNLIDENEQYFSQENLDRLLIKVLSEGRRIATPHWVEICSAIWDELPIIISDELIDTCPIDASISTDDTTLSDDAATRLFAHLIRVDPVRWLRRYRTLSTAERLVVATGLSPASAEVLPAEEKAEVVDLLLGLCQNDDLRQVLSEKTFLTLATLLQSSGKRELSGQFLATIPIDYAAGIGIRYPEFLRPDLVEQEIHMLKAKLSDQLVKNQSGQWAAFSRDPALSSAQAMVALRRADAGLVDLVAEFANAPFTAANDVISSVRALSWLVDERLLPMAYIADRPFEYRSTLSPVDRYWTGRNDLRAVNAAIAGFYARRGEAEALQQLIIAARDPDMEVRLLAIGELSDSTERPSHMASAVDAMILGAIYDPESRVQAAAVALIEQITDRSVYELAWGRLESVWATSHRRVRMAAARVAAGVKADRPLTSRGALLELARRDRSLLVREAAGAKG